MGNTLITYILFYTFIFFNTRWYSCNGNSPNNSTLKCKPWERAALLNFMQSVTYFDEDVSSSWKGEECCNWSRVVCDNTTGHVLDLDLYGNDTNNLLKMEKLDSLVYFLELTQLESLDLGMGFNNFSYSSIPILIGSMKQLSVYFCYTKFQTLGPPLLTAMSSPNASQITDTVDPISEVIQGIERAYTSTLPYLVDIDLSFNNFMGSIPDDMTKISGLLNLNLSYNQLSGSIPVNIGGLKSLVSLDLSNNKLRGSIPISIGELYMLSHLNLSYNNLSGPIPLGNQLQTLSDQDSIYAGNPYLCGDFMPKKCKSKVEKQDKGRSNKGKGVNKVKFEKMGFGLVVMSGFATGFWGVVGSLVLKRRWRHAVFRRVEDGYNWLYVIVALRVAKARRTNKR